MKAEPKRGEVWLVDMGMVEKIRPALILNGPCGETDRNLITIVPHTTMLRGSRFEIDVPLPFLKPGAFVAQSPATLPASRAERLLGRMNDADLLRIEDGLLSWLMIQPRQQG